MAPTVTLTFAGDSQQLEKTFNRVGDSAQNMGGDVSRASDRVRDSGSALDRFGEAADDTDTKAMGFRDTITGVSDTMRAFTEDGLSTEEMLLTLGMGIGDLASGFYNLLIPAVKSLAVALKVGLGKALTLIAAHPVAAALIALAGLFVVLWTNSETFRDIVKAVFSAIWDTVKSVAGWIAGRWDWLVGVMRTAADKIGGFFSGIWDALKAGARGAVNFVISYWNTAISALNGVIEGINLVPHVNIPKIPHIPKLHEGGVVPGARGSETLALLEAGERVIPADRAGGRGGGGAGGAVVVGFRGNTDTAVANLIMRLIRSGDIQLEVT